MKKKYILTAALIALLGITYFSIISPIYKNYKDATIIRNFVEDSDNIFINSWNGLYKINKVSNQISKIKFNSSIEKIVVNKDDVKWFISEDTLYSFKNEHKIIKHGSSLKEGIINDWRDLTIDNVGTIWILYNKYVSSGVVGELYSYKDNTWGKYSIPRNLNDINTFSKIFIEQYGNLLLLKDNHFTSSYEDKDGLIHEKMYWSFDIINFENPFLWEPTSNYDEWRPFWSELDFDIKHDYRQTYVDRNNNVWIALNLDNKSTLYRFNYPDFVKYEINKEIKAISSDKQENIWIATDEGIEILNDKKSFIPKRGIYGIMYIDSNNKIWISNSSDTENIECYNGKEWKSYNYEIFKLVLKEFFSQLF